MGSSCRRSREASIEGSQSPEPEWEAGGQKGGLSSAVGDKET